MKIAVVGATGLVGRELIKLLETTALPLTDLYLFASKEAVATFCSKSIPVHPLSTPVKCDLVFFCVNETIAATHIPQWIQNGCEVIDLSSAFRDSAPLIIPEINPHSISSPLNCSPNCTTTIMLTSLYPLHREAKIKRIVASTYQAASGGGKQLLDRLTGEIKAFATNNPPVSPLACNLFLHPSEEPKLSFETEKILGESIPIVATCVRVPTLRVHALSLNVTFEKPVVTLPKVDKEQTPYSLAGKQEVVVTKCKRDPTYPHTVSLFVLGDQLLKGAALNALQIAESKFKCEIRAT